MAQLIITQTSSAGCRAWVDGEPSKAATGRTQAEAVMRLKGRYSECQLYQIRMLNPVQEKLAEPPPATPAEAVRKIRSKLLVEQDALDARLQALQIACKHVDEKGDDARRRIVDLDSEFQCEVCGAAW
jgi:hypothetical protein